MRVWQNNMKCIACYLPSDSYARSYGFKFDVQKFFFSISRQTNLLLFGILCSLEQRNLHSESPACKWDRKQTHFHQDDSAKCSKYQLCVSYHFLDFRFYFSNFEISMVFSTSCKFIKNRKYTSIESIHWQFSSKIQKLFRCKRNWFPFYS